MIIDVLKTITRKLSRCVLKEPDTKPLESPLNNFFLPVLTNTTWIPRYNYHQSLLEWIWKGLPKDPLFQGCPYEDCSIIVGGNMTEENKALLVGESALIEKVAITELQKG